jgi:tetratricopeptide (TPR) repeat protein
VAWVSERKDLLSACFFLLALDAYCRQARRPGPRRYAVVALLFALGLLSKPMLVTFPFVLLILDWWPLQRHGRGRRWEAAGALALEKLPLFALSAASAWITVRAQSVNDAMVSWDALPPATRIGNAAVACALYLRNTFWPVSLAAFYPHPQGGHPPVLVVAASTLIAGLTIAVVVRAGRRPWLAAGWLWFAGMLVPVIGFVQVGGQALADRYTYLPHVGLFVAVVWGLADRARRAGTPARAILPAVAAMLLSLAAVTWLQAGFWRDQRTVFSRAAAVTTGNFVAHFNLGVAADAEGRSDEAIAHYHEAIRLQPKSFDAHLRLGNALVGRGDVEAGAAAFQLALEARPGSVEALVNLASALARLRRYDQALGALRQAVGLKPGLVEGHMNIGNILSELGRGEEALAAYAQALRHGPERADVHFNLGVTLEWMGRREEAGREYAEALRLRPGYPEARAALARLRPGAR